MSKQTSRRTILKVMAALPFSMSLGAAVNYLIKPDSVPLLVSSDLSPTPSSKITSLPLTDRSGFTKIDASAFSEPGAQVPFSMNVTGRNQSLNGIAIKLADGNIVAYHAEHPEWGCFLTLDNREAGEPVLRCHCHSDEFGITSGATLNDDSKKSLQAFRIKHCHEKICVILEDSLTKQA
ncbi:MAG TPA: hypothetical protein V6C89_20700 [Drouetiella sp.]|jgi:nitrite reductase/ring-hydroxylating ferredoxin subunit